jgi:serine O-acetyltransferase
MTTQTLDDAREDAASVDIDAQKLLWDRIRQEAFALTEAEPLLSMRLSHRILQWTTPQHMLAACLAARLASSDLPETALRELFAAEMADGEILACATRDIAAVIGRDPSSPSPLQVVLNQKGFHGLQTQRVAHRLWLAGRTGFALTLTNDASLRFGVDIHPAARIGCGVMLDHATGIVIGETAVLGDDVSILQNVTLGGTGKECGDRHPKVRNGVMLGAGATILGNIEIGAFAKVAAGSVVLAPVPSHCTVAGVPARIVRRLHDDAVPAKEMCQKI